MNRHLSITGALRLRRRLASLVFAMFVCAYVALVWGFRYLPTYDGPAHLASAVVWARINDPETRYREFYAIEPKNVPNLTSQLLLAGLVRMMPPLVAEKVLVTSYVVGAGVAFWYFATAFGGEARLLAPLGLLFLFNGAFLDGFYNYCLSLIAFWYVAGYCARHPKLGVGGALGLALVFMAAYGTHLVGWLLATLAALWFIAPGSENRARTVLYLAVATAPSFLLAVSYCLWIQLFCQDGLIGIVHAVLRAVSPITLEQRLAAWGYNAFGALNDLSEPPFALFLFVLYEVLIAASLLSASKNHRARSWRKAAALGTFLFASYCVVPEQRGFFLVRLAFLPPMLVIPALRLPDLLAARRVLLGIVYAAVCLNLALVAGLFDRANADIDEYVAGAGAVGENSVIFTAAPYGTSRWPIYLRHAACYYALTNGNVAIGNYQGEPGAFWIELRHGVFRGCGDFDKYPNRNLVDFVLAWEDRGYRVFTPTGCREIFSRGRLHVFATARGLRRRQGG